MDEAARHAHFALHLQPDPVSALGTQVRLRIDVGVTNAHPSVEEVKVIGLDLTKRAGAPAKKKKPVAKKLPAKKAAAPGAVVKKPAKTAPRSTTKAPKSNKSAAKKAPPKPVAKKVIDRRKAPSERVPAQKGSAKKSGSK